MTHAYCSQSMARCESAHVAVSVKQLKCGGTQYSAVTFLIIYSLLFVGDQSDFLFVNNLGLTDGAICGILLVISVALLVACLLGIVKTLSAMMRGQVAAAIRRTVNADFPGKLSFLTGYVTILVGAALTIVIQSSSVFTSTLTPLVGLGVISIERMYPLTLGSNVGTTFTSILAALAVPKDRLPLALQISLCHLFFNISGIVLFFPVPALRRLPIRLAKALGDTTTEHRWFAVAYLILAIVLLPYGVFALSVAGIYARRRRPDTHS